MLQNMSETGMSVDVKGYPIILREAADNISA